MKKIELVYFRGCPSVPNARKALLDQGLDFVEVVQDELPQGDPRRNFCSPSLLVDGEPVIGSRVEEASCTLDRWDSSESRRVLGGISCCVTKDGKQSEPLNSKQRALRVGAGFLFILSAYWVSAHWFGALVLLWFGLSHLVAGASAYGGCPEIGAIPSLILGRSVATHCGPWEWIDRKLTAN